jgi:methylglutaconyl-CoA hydratase|tara:strand:+ start:4416 stop:5204 length:789 start_codon:yes stop_codon:yes gene_type:complete
MTDTVLSAIDSRGVATVTLNNPAKHNAFDDSMISALRLAFDQLRERDDVRVVVLRSEGKHFSAGADLDYMKRMASYDYGHNLHDAEILAGMLRALYELPQPTIARIQGAALGGAVGLASCCDMAVATRGSSFALSEVKIGLVPATISPYVIRAIGERAARRYFLTGERFDAHRALELGLISEVADEESLDTDVARLVDAVLGNGPEAVRAAKDLIASVAGEPLSRELVEDTCARIAHIRVSSEGQEGLSAFLEKRLPNWQEK